MKKLLLGLLAGIITLLLTACPSPPPPAPAGDFSLSVNPITITKGSSGTTTVTINRTNGFADQVALTLGGLAGVTGSFNPASADASSVLTIAVANTVASGSYLLPVTGTADGKTHTAVFSLNVTAVADTTKPKILSVSPTNNKNGVVDTTNIVIRFSEPMNKASGQAAYQSSSSRMKPSEVSFNWNAAGTTLTINPNSNLLYKSITSLGTVAFTYIYKITDTATDLAGNPLANPQTVRFKTLRRMTHKLYSSIDGFMRSDGQVKNTDVFLLIGDGSAAAANKQFKSFVGFNISTLPSSITKIEKATFSAYQYLVLGNPYTDLKIGTTKLQIQHVYFGSLLNFADFNTPVLRNEGNLSTSTSLGYKYNDVTISLKDDYAKRASRLYSSQYMLSFPKISDYDAATDAVAFYAKEYSGTSKDPRLVIVYLLP